MSFTTLRLYFSMNSFLTAAEMSRRGFPIPRRTPGCTLLLLVDILTEDLGVTFTRRNCGLRIGLRVENWLEKWLES